MQLEDDDPDDDIGQSELSALIEGARTGDAGAMECLRARLADPTQWQKVGDLSAHVETALIQMVAGQNLLLAEGLIQRLNGLRAELAYATASPLERLLIERITHSWLEVQYLDVLAVQKGASASPESRELDRRRDTAQQRYLSALKQLSMVRRLLGRSRKAAVTRADTPTIPISAHSAP